VNHPRCRSASRCRSALVGCLRSHKSTTKQTEGYARVVIPNRTGLLQRTCGKILPERPLNSDDKVSSPQMPPSIFWITFQAPCIRTPALNSMSSFPPDGKMHNQHKCWSTVCSTMAKRPSEGYGLPASALLTAPTERTRWTHHCRTCRRIRLALLLAP
jgi:hypothetical protein